jgi:putative transposase
MARLARIVAAGVAHLVVQRGNRDQDVFFGDGDYALYKELLAEGCKAAGTAIWAYCLLSNQVQLLLVPSDAHGLRAAPPAGALEAIRKSQSTDLPFVRVAKALG